jgi:aspartyl-tRNA(Asn)/glutamyl-tRNA(Gln) amidotransferase subunit A
MQSIIEIATGVRSGALRATDMVEACLSRIEARDLRVNAFCHVDGGLALQAAAAVDRLVASGVDPGPLAGVPFGIKDLEDCAGMPTGLGSVFYSGGPAVEYDSLHVARLRAAGAIPIGKVTTAELGFAGDCHTRACGTTRNPWRLSQTAGGSSGGSAAAVAAGMVPFCTGSDGGGSVRAPAAFTGTVGLKPSHGRVPNGNGASENSAYSTLTTTVLDTARCLDVMAGPDNRDRMSLPKPGISYEVASDSLDVAGLRAAWSPDMGFAVVDSEVAEIAQAAARTLAGAAELHVTARPVELTNILPALLAIYTDRLRTRRTVEGYLPGRFNALADATRDIFTEVGTPTAEDLYRHRQTIIRLESEMDALFADIDVLLTPTTACTAFNAEGPWPRIIADRDARETGDAPLTPIANFCWNPSISVPAGTTRSGLPVGLMITGPRHRDEVVLRLARILELASPWSRLAPGY